MKKIMIAFAAIAAVVVTNAATVTWSCTNIYEPGTSTKGSGYIAYLFDADIYDQSDINKSILGGTFAKDYAGSALASKTSTAQGLIQVTGIGNYGASATTSSPEFAHFFSVLFDAGTVADAEHYITTSDVEVKFTSGSGAKPAAWANVSGAGSGTAWQSIPEPTSGLLLLIGMAGLALRRRRA